MNIWYIHDMYTSVFIAPQRPPSTPSSRRSWDQRLPPTELWQLGSWQSVSLQRGIRNPRSQNVKHYERIETYWNNAFLRSHNNCNHTDTFGMYCEKASRTELQSHAENFKRSSVLMTFCSHLWRDELAIQIAQLQLLRCDKTCETSAATVPQPLRCWPAHVARWLEELHTINHDESICDLFPDLKNQTKL